MKTAILVGTAAACSSEPEPAPPDASPPPAITGGATTSYWDRAGTPTVVGARPDGLFIEAEVAVNDVRPARVADDGTFAIDGDAPQGAYWLRIVDPRLGAEDVYVLTRATELDLGLDVVGDDRRHAFSLDTRVDVDASGLASWLDGDDGDFVAPDLGLTSSMSPLWSLAPPAAGDTTLATTYVWRGLPVPAASDTAAILTQVRQVHDDALGLDYTTPIRAFAADQLPIVDGTETLAAGAFAAPPALDIPLHWQRSAFAGLGLSMQPPDCTSAIDFETYWVHALPGHGAHGLLARNFDDPLDFVPTFGPRVVDDVALDGDTDLDGTLHVANPYPADWLYAKYTFDFLISCPVPGLGVAPGNAEAELGVITAGLDDTPVVPLVGPVRAPRIAGQDLFAPRSGVGARPSITWMPPEVGKPTAYEVHVYQVVVRDGLRASATLFPQADLIVPGDVTEITMPRDVLAPDTLYTLRIRAVARDGQHIDTAPFHSGVPLGYADLFTGYFQP